MIMSPASITTYSCCVNRQALLVVQNCFVSYVICCTLNFACCLLQGFASDQCPEGFVSVVKNTLRILAVENVGDTFNQSATRLRYTPRRLVIHPEHKNLIIAESEHGAVPLAEREDLKQRMQVCLPECS